VTSLLNVITPVTVSNAAYAEVSVPDSTPLPTTMLDEIVVVVCESLVSTNEAQIHLQGIKLLLTITTQTYSVCLTNRRYALFIEGKCF
jgi:hypothetical protein